MELKLNITSVELIGEVIELTGASLLAPIAEVPGIKGVPGAYEAVVLAGQMAFADAYKWVYYVSIAFGGISIVVSSTLLISLCGNRC